MRVRDSPEFVELVRVCTALFRLVESGFEVHDSGERERRGVTARAREKGARTRREKPFVEVGFVARRRRER